MPRFDAEITSIDEAFAQEMRGRSWHDDPRCPAMDDLAVLRLPYRNFTGHRHLGRLVVARSVADALVHAFARIEAAGFPIATMDPICTFAGSDARSMAANNCSGFNFRVIAGTDRLSNHAAGLAVDINPIQNPWVREGTVLPREGAEFLDRTAAHPGLIRADGPVVAAFREIGWTWGGEWSELSDYHHFELTR